MGVVVMYDPTRSVLFASQFYEAYVINSDLRLFLFPVA